MGMAVLVMVKSWGLCGWTNDDDWMDAWRGGLDGWREGRTMDRRGHFVELCDHDG